MDKHTYEKGLEVRRAVLGNDYVDRSLNDPDSYTQPLQELLTEFCWGSVWARDGLDRRTRSFLNLSMLCALNRSEELELHIRAALNNGITRDEIREVFLQVIVYCGAPAALSAFRSAKKVFAEIDGTA